MEVTAILVFGYGKMTVRRLRLNLRSMFDVVITVKYRYMEPKRSVQDLAFVDTWSNEDKLEKHIVIFDDMLCESPYTASLTLSYLNRQAYAFVFHDGCVSHVARPVIYNTIIAGG